MPTPSALPAREKPSALQSILTNNSLLDLVAGHPPQQQASVIWNTFKQRVRPIIRISFDWTLRRLESISLHPDQLKRLTNAEHALIFSLYLLGVSSLSEDECRTRLQRSKSLVLSELQMYCEQALQRTDIFCITEITVMQALTYYMVSCMSQEFASYIDLYNSS